MSKRDRLEAEIEEKQSAISSLEEKIKALVDEQGDVELDVDEFVDEYEEMLDDCYEELKIGSLSFLPSRVLKHCDPVAYRCGLSDYVASLDVSESDEYQTLEAEIEDLNDQISDLEDAISELEDELDELDDE